MMSAKLVPPGLLKIKIFRNKGHDVLVVDYGVTNKIILFIWSCDQSFISMIKIWTEKHFVEGWSWLKFNLGLALGMTLKFYTSLTKELKFKVRNLSVPSPTFVEITGEKLVRGHFQIRPPTPRLPPPSWIELKNRFSKNYEQRCC